MKNNGFSSISIRTEHLFIQRFYPLKQRQSNPYSEYCCMYIYLICLSSLVSIFNMKKYKYLWGWCESVLRLFLGVAVFCCLCCISLFVYKMCCMVLGKRGRWERGGCVKVFEWDFVPIYDVYVVFVFCVEMDAFLMFVPPNYNIPSVCTSYNYRGL